MKKLWLQFQTKFGAPKKEQLFILLLFGLLLAVIAIPVEKKESQNVLESSISTEEEVQEETLDYESRMEEKLEALLSEVEGVGRVKVMLTFEGSGEKKVEKDNSQSAENQQEETVYEEYGNSHKSPYVTFQSNPKVEGVLVIAQGGANSSVKQEILEAAQALFGIEAHKIKIMKMEGN